MPRKRPPLRRPALRIPTLKRPPLTRFQKIGFIVVPLVLIPVIVIGVITENQGEAENAATAATQPQEPPTASGSPASEPPPTTDPSEVDDEEPTEYDENHLQFGQTAHFTTYAGNSNTPLEITVSAPTPFTLSKRAKLVDAYEPMYGHKGTRQKTNVYFTVTIKNLSKTDSYDVNVSSEVTETGDDKVLSYVEDGDIGSVWDLGRNGDIRPGKSDTVKDGYSVKSAKNIRYEIHLDGLSGQSFYFAK